LFSVNNGPTIRQMNELARQGNTLIKELLVGHHKSTFSKQDYLFCQETSFTFFEHVHLGIMYFPLSVATLSCSYIQLKSCFYMNMKK